MTRDLLCQSLMRDKVHQVEQLGRLYLLYAEILTLTDICQWKDQVSQPALILISGLNTALSNCTDPF